jgi:hypothetical protein
MNKIDDFEFQDQTTEYNGEWSRKVCKTITLSEIEDIFDTENGDMTLVSQLCRELRLMWKYCSFLDSCAQCHDHNTMDYDTFKLRYLDHLKK